MGVSPSPALSPSSALAAAVLAGLSFAVAGCGGEDEAAKPKPTTAPAAAATPKLPAGKPGKVVKVIDGDTVVVKFLDGQREKVRLLGIDAPEASPKRNGNAECAGDLATGYLSGLVDQYDVYDVALDPSQDAKDKYGRILAYVTPRTRPATPTLAMQVVSNGWAEVYDQPKEPTMIDAELRAAAAEAKSNGMGVWTSCGGKFHQPE